MICSHIEYNQRKRYSFWQALGDIGGFTDGIRLLVQVFMGPLTGVLFMKDALRDRLYALEDTEAQRLEKQAVCRSLYSQGLFVSFRRVLAESVKKVQRLRVGLFRAAWLCLCDRSSHHHVARRK